MIIVYKTLVRFDLRRKPIMNGLIIKKASIAVIAVVANPILTALTISNIINKVSMTTI